MRHPYRVEHVLRILNDENPEDGYLELSSDADGLGLVELQSHDSEGAEPRTMTFSPPQARALGAALMQMASLVEGK